MPRILDKKYRSEFKHDFTNRGCLHCTTLKVLHGFQKKKIHKSRDMQFFPSKCSKWDFQDFQNVYKQLEIHQRSLLNYLKNNQQRQKNTTFIIFLFCHCCWSLTFQKKLFYLKNTFYFILKALLLKIFKFLCRLFGHVEKTVWSER